MGTIGFAAIQNYALGIIGFVMFGVCRCITVISCIVANGAKMKVYVEAIGKIREWVNISLMINIKINMSIFILPTSKIISFIRLLHSPYFIQGNISCT